MMDEDGFDRLATFDAIYLGAIGAPGVPDGVVGRPDPGDPAARSIST